MNGFQKFAGQKMTGVQAIKEFFGMTAREALTEIKALNSEEKQWFGEECAKALGVELVSGLAQESK